VETITGKFNLKGQRSESALRGYSGGRAVGAGRIRKGRG